MSSYPTPDDDTLREWQAITDVLRENLPVDVALLRAAEGGSLKVVATSSQAASFDIGDLTPQDGSNYCDQLLHEGDLLAVPSAGDDPRWDGISEHKAGFTAYLGAALRWPDGEAYGSLCVMRRQPMESAEADRAQRLLQRLGIGASAQLALLVKQEQSHYEATHDALTGLPNRVLFQELATVQMRVAERNSAALWMVMWSVDDFSNLAEERGREDINTMLQRVSERARSCIRQSDVLARLGDNQFAFMLAGANEFVANAVADRLRRNLMSLNPWPRKGNAVTASCGLTAYRSDEALDDWLARARKAVKEATATGGDTALVLDAN